MTRDEGDHGIPVDCGKSRSADGTNEMVYGIKQKHMHVDEVAGNQKGQDLSLTVRQQAIAAGHAACDNEGRARRGPFDQNVYIALEAFVLRTQCLQQADVLVRQQGELQELRYERISRPVTFHSALIPAAFGPAPSCTTRNPQVAAPSDDRATVSTPLRRDLISIERKVDIEMI